MRTFHKKYRSGELFTNLRTLMRTFTNKYGLGEHYKKIPTLMRTFHKQRLVRRTFHRQSQEQWNISQIKMGKVEHFRNKNESKLTFQKQAQDQLNT